MTGVDVFERVGSFIATVLCVLSCVAAIVVGGVAAILWHVP